MKLLLVIACTLSACPALAASSALTGVPLLYDSQNRLIGPYPDGEPIVNVAGHFVKLAADEKGFKTQYTFYFKSGNCSNGRFMLYNLTPQGGVAGGVIYYPSRQHAVAAINSFMNSDGVCHSLQQNLDVGGVVVETVSSLNFTTPFVLKAP